MNLRHTKSIIFQVPTFVDGFVWCPGGQNKSVGMGLVLSSLYVDLEDQGNVSSEPTRPMTRRSHRQASYEFDTRKTSSKDTVVRIRGPSGPLTIDALGYHYEGPSVQDLKRILKLTDYKGLCRDFIQDKFLSDTLRTCNLILVGNSNTEVLGFVLAHETSDNVSIEAICAHAGHGTSFLQFFLEYLDFRVPQKDVGLHSMPHVLSWYTKFGFELRESCASPVVHVPNYLWPDDAPKRRITYEEAYQDPQWRLLMEYLMSKQLNVKKKNCTRPSQLAKNNCADEGFFMNLCK